MKIRLGYACISETLNITSSKTYQYTRFAQEQNYQKLDQLIQSNFLCLHKLLTYNNKNNIHFFRISSNIIPLATKEEVIFDYIKPYQMQYQQLAKYIEKYNMRVDFHPSEYCVLNSTKKQVIENSIAILTYHRTLLSLFKVKDPLLVLHIGSSEFGKEKSISRFINQYNKLPLELKECIAIENDDKVYTIEDCLKIATKLHIPVILDYHHHICNPSIKPMEELLPEIYKTWTNKTPKMHFSSPKSNQKKEFRSHHDYINVDEFISFLEILKQIGKDTDIMIEAKKKDEALFRLVRELKYKTDIPFLDETTFMI